MRIKRKADRGVTLIELVVVILIIGIIAGLGTEYLIGFRSKYRIDTSAKDMAGRLRLAKTLCISKNMSVTTIFNTLDDSYYSFLDASNLGAWDSGEEYVNLDSGAVSAYNISLKEMHTDVSMYNAVFGGRASITVSPPSGLPNVTMFPPSLTNGVVCMSTEIDTDGGNDDFEYRRLTVTPVTGRIKLWRGKSGDINRATPECAPPNYTNWEEQ
ncbi:MAG: prepilin-type N-terminal cleavage/methylation domain-containing protein [Nitrospirae bacterium]|nr:prepilin-type N-terminal cleavage/methylation domain-containing protein [Nitrospirota bacterium]